MFIFLSAPTRGRFLRAKNSQFKPSAQGNNLPAQWAKIVAQWAESTDRGAER